MKGLRCKLHLVASGLRGSLVGKRLKFFPPFCWEQFSQDKNHVGFTSKQPKVKPLGYLEYSGT